MPWGGRFLRHLHALRLEIFHIRPDPQLWLHAKLPG